MFTISVGNQNQYKTNVKVTGNRFEGQLNDKFISGDFVKISPWQFNVLYNHQSYTIEVIKLNTAEKTMIIKVNSQRFSLSLKDKYDELLHSLGLDAMAAKKINDIKAPMPGMVLNVLVKEGQEVKKGDALLVLEAMKMENIIKSPSDGLVKKININKGTAVEKNQLLIQF